MVQSSDSGEVVDQYDLELPRMFIVVLAFASRWAFWQPWIMMVPRLRSLVQRRFALFEVL